MIIRPDWREEILTRHFVSRTSLHSKKTSNGLTCKTQTCKLTTQWSRFRSKFKKMKYSSSWWCGTKTAFWTVSSRRGGRAKPTERSRRTCNSLSYTVSSTRRPSKLGSKSRKNSTKTSSRFPSRTKKINKRRFLLKNTVSI